MHHWHDAPSPPSEARHEARSGRPLQPAEDMAAGAGAARMVAALTEGGVVAAARRRRAGSFMGDWGLGGESGRTVRARSVVRRVRDGRCEDVRWGMGVIRIFLLLDLTRLG